MNAAFKNVFYFICKSKINLNNNYRDLEIGKIVYVIELGINKLFYKLN